MVIHPQSCVPCTGNLRGLLKEGILNSVTFLWFKEPKIAVHDYIDTLLFKYLH